MDELLEATAASGAPRELMSDDGHREMQSAVDASVSANNSTSQGKRADRKQDEGATATDSDAISISSSNALAAGGAAPSVDMGVSGQIEQLANHENPAVAPAAPLSGEERQQQSEVSEVVVTVTSPDAVVTTTTTTTTTKTTVTVQETQTQRVLAVEKAVVEFIRSGGSVTAAAAKFGLSRMDVSKIIKVDAEAAPVIAAAGAGAATAAAAVSARENGSGSEFSDDSSTDARVVAEDTQQEQSTRKRKAVGADGAGAGAGGAASVEVSALTPSKAKAAVFEDNNSSAADSGNNKAKRVRKSKEEKIAILEFVEQGGTHVAAAEKFGISRTAVTKMVKEKEIIWSKVAASAAAAQSSAEGSSGGVQQQQSISETGAAGALVPATSSAPKKERMISSSSSSSNSLLGLANRKGKRVRKTNVEKLEILAFVEQGGSQGAAAEKYGVSRTAVTKMVKEKEAISAQATSDSTNHRKVLQYQHKLSIIEDMLYKWQVQVEFEAPSLKVTGDLLQSKAMEFRNKILADFSSDLPDEVVMSLTDFKASNGWLHRYTQRRNVRSMSKNEHHSIPADPSYVEKRMERIRTQLALAHVPLHCIWNLDEAVIRHRTTSSRVDAPINLDARSQEKLTVAFGVSAAGEKLSLQAIGASSQPTSLKEVDPVLTFGVYYHGQRKACQDSTTLMHFVSLMSNEARSRKQVWYILLDNCPSHMAAASILDPNGSYEAGFKVDSVVLIVLPPNSVSSQQPLQLGVIRSFKVGFRREMLRTILGEYAEWEAEHAGADQAVGASSGAHLSPTFDVHSLTHSQNALLWLQRAWSSTSMSSIRQAWAKSSYLPTHLLPELSEDMSRPIDSAIYADFVELLTMLLTKKHLLTTLGLDNLEDTEQVAIELISLDDPETVGANNEVNDDEIVMESLSAQGLIRESHRAANGAQSDGGAAGGVLPDSTPEIASIGDACATVEKLLRFMDKTSQEQVAAIDRRAGRSNLLALHRILLKARAKERSSTAYTV